MNAQPEARLSSLGCLLVLIGVCTFGYLAYSSHWAYTFAVVSLIGVGLLIVRIGKRRDHHRHVEVLRLAFAPSGLPVPQFEDGYRYGFPSFTLTFPSEAELKQAEALGCITAFKQAIQTLHGHTGSKRNPFDVNRAIWITYVGWKPSMRPS